MLKEKLKFIDILKTLSKKAKIAVLSVTAVLIAAVMLIIVFAPSGKTTYSASSSLKKVLTMSDIYTAEYTYKSIAKVALDPKKPAEDGNIKYQVLYSGTVKSGFDTKEIAIKETEDSIIVIIPKITVSSVAINENLDFIFVKEKYNTENVYTEAYNACCNHLEEKASENKTLYNTAIESAITHVSALAKPFEKQLDNQKKIEVIYIDNYLKGAK